MTNNEARTMPRGAVKNMYWNHLKIFKQEPGRWSLKGVYEHNSSFRHLFALAGLAGAVWLVWGIFGVQVFHTLLCRDTPLSCNIGLSELGAVGDIFGGVNALFAAMALLASIGALVHTRKVTDEERLLNHDGEFAKQIQNCYQWAFEALAEGQGVTKNAERWKEASLRLLNAELLFEALHSSVYKVIAAEHRNYWRHRFQRLFTPAPSDGVSFFFSIREGKIPSSEAVDPRAAYVIGDFAFGYVISGELINQVAMPPHDHLEVLMPGDFGSALSEYLRHLEGRGDARTFVGQSMAAQRPSTNAPNQSKDQ